MCAKQQHYHMENHVTQTSLSDLFTYPPGAGSIHMLRCTGSAVVYAYDQATTTPIAVFVVMGSAVVVE